MNRYAPQIPPVSAQSASKPGNIFAVLIQCSDSTTTSTVSVKAATRGKLITRNSKSSYSVEARSRNGFNSLVITIPGDVRHRTAFQQVKALLCIAQVALDCDDALCLLADGVVNLF